MIKPSSFPPILFLLLIGAVLTALVWSEPLQRLFGLSLYLLPWALLLLCPVVHLLMHRGGRAADAGGASEPAATPKEGRDV